MAILRRTRPADFASGDAFAKALWGSSGDRTFYGTVQRNMEVALAEELPKLDVAASWSFPPGEGGGPPKWTLVQIGTRRLKDWTGFPHSLLREVKVGSVANWRAKDTGPDIWPVVQAIYAELIKRSPLRKPSTSGVMSNPSYRRAHEVYVGTRRVAPGTKPTGLVEEDQVRLLNRVEYAAVLETSDYPRAGGFQTYQKVLAWAQKRYGRDVDITMTFADPQVFRGHRYTKPWAVRRKPIYAIPVITVAALNTLPLSFGGNLVIKKRRTLRQRTNPLALAKKRRR